jgi:DNA-binding transcriptional MerR regulator
MGIMTYTYDYTAKEVCDELGITYRQLMYWVAKGYVDVESRGSGITLYFTPSQLERVKEIRDAFDEADEILERAGIAGSRISGRSR